MTLVRIKLFRPCTNSGLGHDDIDYCAEIEEGVFQFYITSLQHKKMQIQQGKLEEEKFQLDIISLLYIQRFLLLRIRSRHPDRVSI